MLYCLSRLMYISVIINLTRINPMHMKWLVTICYCLLTLSSFSQSRIKLQLVQMYEGNNWKISHHHAPS
jgi:hypothetical protein